MSLIRSFNLGIVQPSLLEAAVIVLFCSAVANAEIAKSGAPSGLPTTCEVGDEYVTAADHSRYACTATNKWTKQITPESNTGVDPVLFYDSGNYSGDSVDFVWDAANHRLGLGNPAPANRLDILNGSLKLNSGRTSSEAFNLSGRVGVGFPVPYFTPTTANSVVAFDVYPKGTPTDFTANTGVAWFDLCSTDINSDSSGYECLRMGKFANGDAHVGAAKGGNGTVRNLDLQINGGNVGVGTTTPVALLSVGSSSPFQVNSSGNITKLNNVPTNFPSANGAGYLTNDGNGNFSYTNKTISATYVASALPTAPVTGTIVKVSDGASISDCMSGSGNIARSCEWDGHEWQFSPVGGYVLSAQPGTIPAESTTFAAPGMSTIAVKELSRQYVVARACQISNMYLNIGGDQPTTGAVMVTVRIAQGGSSPVDTSISAAVPAGTQPGAVISDTAHKADVGAGDLISIRLENSAHGPVDLLTLNLYCAY